MKVFALRVYYRKVRRYFLEEGRPPLLLHAYPLYPAGVLTADLPPNAAQLQLLPNSLHRLYWLHQTGKSRWKRSG